MTSYTERQQKKSMGRRCGLYVRVSTDRQVSEEGSLISQTQRLREELKRRSTPSDPWSEAKVYVEEGVSGKDLNRPKMIEMVNDIRAGLINTVICTELSRISRSVMDFLNFAQFLQDEQVGFICLKQQFDTVSPHGRVLVTVCMALAQFERELTAERTSENLLARARRGLRNGGQVFGYDVDPKRKGYLIPNESETVIVNLMFDKYLELGSVEEVARFLNKSGYKTKGYTAQSSSRVHKPHTFTKQVVHWILANRSYLGEVEINRMEKNKDQASLPEKKRYAVTKAVWPPIISEAKFREVQHLLRQNGQVRKNITARTTHNFVLKGLVHCGTCEALLENGSGTSKDGRLHFYYRHRSAGRKDDCTLPSLRAQTIETLVVGRLGYLADRKDIIAAIAERANRDLEQESPRVMALLGERKREYARLSRELDQFAQKVLELDNQTLKDLIVPRVEDLKKQREKISEEIIALQKDLDGLKDNAVTVLSIQEMLQSFEILYEELPPHKQRELMGYIVKQITVMKTEIEMALFGRASLERFDLAGPVFARSQNWLRD